MKVKFLEEESFRGELLTTEPKSDLFTRSRGIRMDKKATLADIATLAGVSRATVSYVLTGRKKVSKETAERVLEIANELGYQQRESAQKGRDSIKENLIGLLVLPNWVKPEEDFFVFAILEGIQKRLKEAGLSMAYSRINQLEDANDELLLSFASSVSGLVILNPGDDQIYDDFITNIKKLKVPHVLIGTPNDDNTFYIDMDIVSAAYQSASALLLKGCSNIYYIDSPIGMKQSNQILRGYKLAYDEQERPWDDSKLIHVEGTSFEEGMRIAEELLARGGKIDGIITSNDILARGVLNTLQKHKYKIPEECKIISLGGGVVSSQISFPKISSIDYNPIEIGGEATEMLLEIISKKRMRVTHSLFPALLIERETSWGLF